MSTEGPSWGYSKVVLGAIRSFLEPFCGHLSPKIDKVSNELTLRYPPKGLALNRRASRGCWPRLRLGYHNNSKTLLLIVCVRVTSGQVHRSRRLSGLPGTSPPRLRCITVCNRRCSTTTSPWSWGKKCSGTFAMCLVRHLKNQWLLLTFEAN